MAWASSFLHLPHQTPLNTTGTLLLSCSTEPTLMLDHR